MSKWHYYNTDGDKIEVTGGQLKGLAKAGLITPGTLVETENGVKAPAKKVKGLTFAASLQSDAAFAETAVAEMQTPSSTSVPLAEVKSSVVLTEETNPFTVSYSPDQAVKMQPSTIASSAPSAVSAGTSNKSNSGIYNLFCVSSATVEESKQKSMVFGFICLICLAIFALIWVPVFSSIEAFLDSQTGESYGIIPHLCFSAPVALVLLIFGCFWAYEKAIQDQACPKCKTLYPESSSEDVNTRHVTEKEAITLKDEHGNVTTTNLYKDVQKTKYDSLTTYKCKQCGHIWTKTVRNLTK